MMKLIKNIKKIIFIGSLGFLFFGLSSNIDHVYAQSTGDTASSTQDQKDTALAELSVTLDVFLNFLYVILWPILAITGMALDNTLVYGSVFHLDQILRQIWTIVMYLSFIFLGVWILRDILQKAISGGDVQSVVKKGVPRWILAGILIPLSRFLMGVVIDLSTIAIYQIGNIPLTIAGIDSEIDQKLLKTHSSIDLNSEIKQSQKGGFRYSTYYSCKEENFLPCKVQGYKIIKSEQEDYIDEFIENNNMATGSISTEYCVMTPTQLYKLEYQGGGTGAYMTMTGEDFKNGIIKGKEHMSSCDSVKTIIQKSQTMVGPLYTIYGSLLNFASINYTDDSKPLEAEVVIFLIKSVIGLLLVIPLIGLAVMSIGRVGMLWLAIAFSPLIVMFKLFKSEGKLGDLQKGMNFKRGINAKFDLSNIIKLIFQPVLTVFALGLSLILLSATTSMLLPDTNNPQNNTSNRLLQSFNMKTETDNQNNAQCLDIEGYVTTCVTDFPNKFTATVFADYFSWIIANIIGILVMRNLLFASMKGNEITDNMVGAVEKVGNNFLKNNIPIFGGYSYESVFGDDGISRVYSDVVNKFTEDKTKDRAQVVKKRLENMADGTFSKMDSDIDFSTPKGADGKDITDPNTLISHASNDFATKVSKLDKSKSVFITENDLSNLKKYKVAGGYSGSNLAEYLGDKKFWDFMNSSEEGNRLLSYLLSMNKKEVGTRVGEKNVDTFMANRSNIGNMLGLTSGIKDGQTTAASISPNIKKDGFITYEAEVKNVNGKTTYQNIKTSNIKQESVSSINEFIKNYPYMRDKTKEYYNDTSKYIIDENNKSISLVPRARNNPVNSQSSTNSTANTNTNTNTNTNPSQQAPDNNAGNDPDNGTNGDEE